MSADNKRLSKFFKDNWVITLFSTMFGVIAGLYLTDYYEDQQLNRSKLSALEMVKQEIANNKETLSTYDSICRSIYDKSSYVFSKMNTNKEIFVSKDSVEVFKSKSDGIIEDLEFESSSTYTDKLRVRGDMNMFVGSKLALVDLNDVIWKSYKQTNYVNVTDFSCITSIEELYQFQTKNNATNSDWMDYLMQGHFLRGEEELAEFMFKWVKALEMNEILLNAYNNIEVIFEDCK
ncbi:hypothetical protein [Winogradskyella sp.]|uniref:hypothetical protein n=1 Tax=Winogradskyella sp. TaxID=1883156 RepID=UPI003BAC63EA